MRCLECVLLSLHIVIIVYLVTPVGSSDAPDVKDPEPDPCTAHEVVDSEGRHVTDGSSPGTLCDTDWEEVRWYKFVSHDQPTTIPTTCLKPQSCGSEVALRVELDGKELPAEGSETKAFSCGAYDVLGKYDCCVLRQEIRIRNCSTFLAYRLPRPDRCSAAYCVQGVNETVPLIARVKTGEEVNPVMTLPPVTSPASTPKVSRRRCIEGQVWCTRGTEPDCTSREACLALPVPTDGTTTSGDVLPTTVTGAPTPPSTTLLPGDTSTTLLPGDTSTTLPPSDTSTTLPPSDTSTTLPPGDTSTTLPPGDTTTTLPPSDTNTTLPPSDTSTTLPPSDTTTTLPPSDTSTTLPPSDTSTTLPPSDTSTTLPPSDTSTTLPPSDTNTTLPPSDTSTTLPPSDTSTTLPPSGTSTTLPPGDTTTTLPPSDTSTTLPPSDTSTTLPPSDTSTTLPPSDTTTTLPPGDPSTPLPPSDTSTTLPPSDTSTSLPPSDTSITLPPSDTSTTLPPSDTSTSLPSGVSTTASVGTTVLRKIYPVTGSYTSTPSSTASAPDVVSSTEAVGIKEAGIDTSETNTPGPADSTRSTPTDPFLTSGVSSSSEPSVSDAVDATQDPPDIETRSEEVDRTMTTTSVAMTTGAVAGGHVDVSSENPRTFTSGKPSSVSTLAMSSSTTVTTTTVILSMDSSTAATSSRPPRVTETDSPTTPLHEGWIVIEINKTKNLPPNLNESLPGILNTYLNVDGKIFVVDVKDYTTTLAIVLRVTRQQGGVQVPVDADTAMQMVRELQQSGQLDVIQSYGIAVVYIYKYGERPVQESTSPPIAISTEHPTSKDSTSEESSYSLFYDKLPLFIAIIVMTTGCVLICLFGLVYLHFYRHQRSWDTQKDMERARLKDKREKEGLENPLPVSEMVKDEHCTRETTLALNGSHPPPADSHIPPSLTTDDEKCWIVPIDQAPPQSDFEIALRTEDTKL